MHDALSRQSTRYGAHILTTPIDPNSKKADAKERKLKTENRPSTLKSRSFDQRLMSLVQENHEKQTSVICRRQATNDSTKKLRSARANQEGKVLTRSLPSVRFVLYLQDLPHKNIRRNRSVSCLVAIVTRRCSHIEVAAWGSTVDSQLPRSSNATISAEISHLDAVQTDIAAHRGTRRHCQKGGGTKPTVVQSCYGTRQRVYLFDKSKSFSVHSR